MDTGAMYRALTLRGLRTGVDPEDARALADLASTMEIRFEPAARPGGTQRVFLDGEDVTREIRTREVDVAVSPVSRHAEVRERFRDLQRRMALGGGVVMEGRDIGSVVLPDADIKIYLDAEFDCRVCRRYREFSAKGYRPRKEEVRRDMACRDLLDSSRQTAPLTVARGAIRIDTTHMTLEEVVNAVVKVCQERGVRS